MKKYIIVFLLVLMSYPLNGCSDESRSDSNSVRDDVNVSNNTQVETEREIISPLTHSDFSITDGDNIVKIDSAYDDFEVNLVEMDYENNYVGVKYNGDYAYKTYVHEYVDFILYTSNTNYNIKDRDFDSYYITQITLKTPEFKTLRGLGIGSSLDEIKNLYGEYLEEVVDGRLNAIYVLEDKKLSFVIDKSNIIVEVYLTVIVEDIE